MHIFRLSLLAVICFSAFFISKSQLHCSLQCDYLHNLIDHDCTPDSYHDCRVFTFQWGCCRDPDCILRGTGESHRSHWREVWVSGRSQQVSSMQLIPMTISVFPASGFNGLITAPQQFSQTNLYRLMDIIINSLCKYSTPDLASICNFIEFDYGSTKLKSF